MIMKNYIGGIYHKIMKRKICHADRVTVVPNLDSREFEVDNWQISEFIVKKLVSIVGIRPYPINELSLMVAAMCRFQPQYVFEWGTNIGSSCRIFYETAKKFDISTEIHSIDLPSGVQHAEHPGHQRGYLVKNLKNVHLHLGDGLDKSFEILRGIRLSGDTRLMFFLDGDHAYHSVRRELEAIIRNYPDAIILVHDTFYQSEESLYNTGPHRAINDILPNCYRRLSQDLGLPGMTLVYKKHE